MEKGRNRNRLLLFPMPLQGHIIPMFQLAEILYSKGFSITIIHTDFNAPNPKNYPNWEFKSISIDLSADFEVSVTNVLEFVNEINVKCVEPFRVLLSQLLNMNMNMNMNDDHDVSCLIPDSLFNFTRTVSDTFGLRQIVLRTGGISAFLAYTCYPFLQEQGYLPIRGFPESRMEETIPQLPMLRVKDLPFLEGNLELVETMMQETEASSGMIWNSFVELEEPALSKLCHMFSSIQLFPIGPFHKFFPETSSSSSSSSLIITPDNNCISWLDKQKHNSVIYVSFGSIAEMDDNQIMEIASALANVKHPFLWVIRCAIGESSKKLPQGLFLPESFDEERGRIVKWAPQQQALAHPAVGAFWTHNGWNSTVESICEGVPMMCTPFFADQMLNARYVTHVWKIGLAVEIGWKKEKIEQVINKVMEEKEGEDIRKRALQFKDLARICLRPGGSSHESLNKLANFISSF